VPGTSVSTGVPVEVVEWVLDEVLVVVKVVVAELVVTLPVIELELDDIVAE